MIVATSQQTFGVDEKETVSKIFANKEVQTRVFSMEKDLYSNDTSIQQNKYVRKIRQ